MTNRIDAHFVAAGKYHDIDFARLEILKLLMEHPHIRTSVACDFSNVERIDACQFLITYCCDLMPTKAQIARIRKWVEKGGKWIALHGTNSILKLGGENGVETPNERPDVMEALGTQFKAHPPIGTFKVEVADPTHPLVKGLADFEIEDELYLSHRTAEIDVLLKTEFEGIADGFETAEWSDKEVPILYLRPLGQGAVLYNTLGHCRGHYDLPEIRPFNVKPDLCSWAYPIHYEILRRCLLWAMREGD